MTTEFGALAAGAGVGYGDGTAPFLSAQFRDPLDPFGKSNSTLQLKVLTSQWARCAH
jgi:hypothetical protein